MMKAHIRNSVALAGGGLLAAALWLAISVGPVLGQGTDAKPRMDIYGFAMMDMGYQTGQNDPDWFDVLRATRLPAFENQYGSDGRWYMGVRQSRLGVQAWAPTDLGELFTIFEFELFGVGVDAGQTTMRLRHAYGELGKFGAGQYWSPFMDIDVFPNSIEYWGPTGMAFFRNVQFRFIPWTSESGSRFVVAVERPGASGDRGVYADRIELQGVQPRFPAPDLSGHFRYVGDFGHVQLAGIVRYINWDDNDGDAVDLSGDGVGYGVNLSTNLKLAEHVVRASAVVGQGIQNYMNDAPVDVGIETSAGTGTGPMIEGKMLPLVAFVAFLDLNWNAKWTSTVGGSYMEIDNSNGQSPDAFRTGMYALANVLYHPAPNVFLGPEVQWGQRENFSDDFKSDDLRVQFSAKYNFKHSLGGK